MFGVDFIRKNLASDRSNGAVDLRVTDDYFMSEEDALALWEREHPQQKIHWWDKIPLFWIWVFLLIVAGLLVWVKIREGFITWW